MKSEGQRGCRLSSGCAHLAVCTLGVLLLAPWLRAEEPSQSARAVRLGFVQGQVQISQGNQVLADPAPVNAPLFEGTQVTTGDDGRAEIQFEDGSVARLSPNSALTLTVLNRQNDANTTQVVLEHGLAYFEVQGSASDQMSVRFGDAVATTSGFTVLRVDMDTIPGKLAVFAGNAHVERGDSFELDVNGGESVTFSARANSAYNLLDSIEPNSWDAWNADRDRALQAEFGAQTGATKDVSGNNNPAWADLDANGNWYNVPGQGYVWSPYEAANQGWDPYGNGNWMWNPGYGYIWISGNPWGYMPYQCGAWNYYGNFGWGWAPGAGMCQPWWGGGNWGYLIGTRPPWYRFPIRPHPRPGPHPMQAGNPDYGGKIGPRPLIAVNRGVSATPPVHVRSALVTSTGQTVQPLRPLSPRPQYSRAANGFMSQQSPAEPGSRPATALPTGNGSRSVYVPAPRTQPAYPSYSSPRPMAPSPSYSRPAPAAPSYSAPSPSAGAGGAPHASGGGGGGGGPHH